MSQWIGPSCKNVCLLSHYTCMSHIYCHVQCMCYLYRYHAYLLHLNPFSLVFGWLHGQYPGTAARRTAFGQPGRIHRLQNSVEYHYHGRVVSEGRSGSCTGQGRLLSSPSNHAKVSESSLDGQIHTWSPGFCSCLGTQQPQPAREWCPFPSIVPRHVWRIAVINISVFSIISYLLAEVMCLSSLR